MSKVKDLTGMRFEKLTVIKRDNDKKGNMTYWICRCDCGNVKSIRRDKLTSKGKDKVYSCGCHRKEVSKQPRKDITGVKFGMLTAIKYIGDRKWLFECECGNLCKINPADLNRKYPILSCGCLKTSYGEQRIKELLDKNKINYAREVSFADLLSDKGRVLRYDFAILDLNGNIIKLIEFDGPQHYDTNDRWYSEDLAVRDKKKDDYARNKGIELIRIKYDKKDDITLELLGLI